MILLGSTGSIGVNALNIAREFGLEVEVLSAGENIELLNRQIEEFKPKYVSVLKRELVSSVRHDRVLWGEDGILEIINLAKSTLVVNALVGSAGVKPTMEALKCGKKLALANKESLVVAGAFLDSSKIVPIDSEHFGIWYLLNDRSVNKITITASGGAFRDTPLDMISQMGAKEALEHPNWKMGKKITIDSATMVNKLFELLEAKWLFGTDSLEAVIERSSTIHALIDFVDGSTTAHFAKADMRLPIAYALLENGVTKNIVPNIDLLKIGKIEFEKISKHRYPIWQIKDEVLKEPKRGVVINAANEVAVKAFLDGKIGFLDISDIIIDSFKKFGDIGDINFEELFEIDREVRSFAGVKVDA